MNRISEHTGNNADRVASHLRMQLLTLRNCLEAVEQGNNLYDGYIEESLRHVEIELRRFRNAVSES